MTGIETRASGAARRERLGDEQGGAAAITACLADGLYLAATPAFAVMALITGLSDDPMSRLCSIDSGSLLSGMLPMYLLMSVLHSPPWLKLIVGHWAMVRRHRSPPDSSATHRA